MRERPPPSSIARASPDQHDAAAGLHPLREPRPRPDAAAEVVEVPAGGDGEGDEERKEEKEQHDHERDVDSGPLPVPPAVEELAEAQARVGNRLEEGVAGGEHPPGNAPPQVEGAES